MNSLADLNRRKRDFAFSGRATTADIPWLYAVQAEQAAANQPAGIGDGARQGGEEAAAPNPQSFGGGAVGGGGASGGADTGMPGPGQTGLGEEFDQYYRDWAAEGGQHGEGVGQSDPWGGLSGYVDPSLAEWTGYLMPGPIGLVGSLGAAGMRAANASTFDSALDRLGLEGLGFFDQLGAAFGMNSYGDMSQRDRLSEIDRQVSERRAAGGDLSGFDSFNEGLQGNLSPSSIGDTVAARAQSRVGPLDFFGASSTPAGSAYGGAEAAAGRSAYSNTAPGRRGARDNGRDGGGGADQGHGGGGDLGGDRNDRAGGPRHDGGPIYGEPGEEVDHTLLAGEYVMNPEAVEMFGAEHFEGLNAMAQMYKGGGFSSDQSGRRSAQDKNPPAMAIRGAGVPPPPPEGRVAANERRWQEGKRDKSKNALAMMMKGRR